MSGLMVIKISQATKVSAPYVDLEKLKANPKDYQKYVKYNTQYRLSASADTMGLKEVA